MSWSRTTCKALNPQTLQDDILVMNSLQKPKKLTLVGSDGLEYPFLAKPKDDLRKDYRCGGIGRGGGGKGEGARPSGVCVCVWGGGGRG